MKKIKVQEVEISILSVDDEDYISLTDMVKGIENGLALIEKWLRNKNTIEFLGIWEEMYNPAFNSTEFGGIRNEAGTNRFLLSVKQWVEKTNSRGIIYASEADVLNVALFGQTHQQWQLAHPDLKGNQRDYADINQLICISNMENINAVMINDGIPQPQRLKKLNEIAIQQMRILCEVDGGRNLLK